MFLEGMRREKKRNQTKEVISHTVADMKTFQRISSATDMETFQRISKAADEQSSADQGKTGKVEKRTYYWTREEWVTDKKNGKEEPVDFESEYDTRIKCQQKQRASNRIIVEHHLDDTENINRASINDSTGRLTLHNQDGGQNQGQHAAQSWA